MTPRTERERLEQVLIGQSELMFQVHLWLAEEQKRDDLIRAVVRSSRQRIPVKARGLDPERVFDLAATVATHLPCSHPPSQPLT